MTYYPPWYQQMVALLEAPDPEELHGYSRTTGRGWHEGRQSYSPETIAIQRVNRGHVRKQEGRPDRQSTVFLPLVTRWAQRRYIDMTEGVDR